MELIDKAGELNAKIKTLEAELKKYKEQLKAEGQEVICGSMYKAEIVKYNKEKLNVDKATDIAIKNDLKWVLKPVIDEDALNDAILTEEIDPQLFKDCIEVSEITKISFKPLKKGK